MTFATSEADSSTAAVLRFLQGVLEKGKPSSLAGILEGLVHAFGADGAGLLYPLSGPAHLSQASWAKGPVDAFPWEKNTAILDDVKKTGSALPLKGPGDASWLLTLVSQPCAGDWLLWIAARGHRVWSNAETAALTLAGECVGRHVARHPDAASWIKAVHRAQTQDGIERTATVTTRLAHDFGNILTGILGFAELALPQTKPDSLPHRYLSEVLNSARQGARWVQRLQLFSRRFQPKFVPVGLEMLLKEEQAKPHWGKGIDLLAELPADLPKLAIEADSMRHVLASFLDNAREAITGEGHVTVTARSVDLPVVDCLELLGNTQPGRHVEVTIRDNGVGIAPQMQEKLFRELFASTRGRRRGLGLAVAYGILHSFQAGFRLSSLPGQGTTVQIYIPADGSEPPAAKTPAATQEHSRILIVDDDPLILRSLARTLEGAGYRVRSAPGPNEAIAQFSQAAEPFQLVLTDVVMPECSGLEMARRILSRDPKAHFLFISSQTHHDPLLARFPFLSKPFESPALLKSVGAALGQAPVPADV